MPSVKIFLASGFFLVNFFSIFDSVKSWREIAAEEKILDSINGITIEKPYAKSLGNHGLEIINGITNYTYSDAAGEPVPCYYYGLTQTGRTVLVTKSGWVNVPHVNIQQAESLNANNNIISRSNAKSWPTRMLFSSFGSIIIFLFYQISCAAERKK